MTGVFATAYFGLLIATVGCVVALGVFGNEVREIIAQMEQAQGETAADPITAFFHHYNSQEADLRIYQHGPFLDMVINRAIRVIGSLISLPFATGWYLLGCFLLGATLLRSGIFHHPDETRAATRRMILLGLLVGVPFHLAALGCYLAGNPAAPMGLDMWTPLAWLMAAWGALALSVGYIGLLLRWSVSGWLSGLQFLLRSVGRMALTNYLMQSVLCGLVFYSYGLGWFGHMSRPQTLLVVGGVWLLELIWSPIWLRFFTMGPVEWLWRSLADRRFRPLPRRAGDAA